MDKSWRTALQIITFNHTKNIRFHYHTMLVVYVLILVLNSSCPFHTKFIIDNLYVAKLAFTIRVSMWKNLAGQFVPFK